MGTLTRVLGAPRHIKNEVTRRLGIGTRTSHDPGGSTYGFTPETQTNERSFPGSLRSSVVHVTQKTSQEKNEDVALISIPPRRFAQTCFDHGPKELKFLAHRFPYILVAGLCYR
jgi:hypothetical protein